MSSLAARFAATIAALLLAAIIVAVALGFLAFGVYLNLMELMSAHAAAFATAIAALFLAIIVLLIARGVCDLAARHRGREKSDRSRADASRLAAFLGDALGGEFAAVAAAHPGTTVIGSLVSGFAVGASPAMRHALRDLIFRK
jgi:hypothetical protein